jgi:hypothetical protein
MKLRLLALAALLAVSSSSFAGPAEPKRSVALAKTWEAAVEEAKLLNVPIVVHSHGFYCGPCWGMHDAVMCNKKYIEFANDNTVEVIALQRLDEGIEKKDKRAETYEAKVNGETVQYMVEFPGLTVEDMLALGKSKANTYNDTGGIPYTALVNPWNEEKLTFWKGGTSAGTIEEAVLEARKAMTKEHGKGVARKDVKALADAEAAAAAKVAKGEFSAAIDALAKVSGKMAKAPDAMKTRYEASKGKIVEAAEKAIASVEEKKAEDPSAAKTALTALLARLKGTGLEQRAKDLLATL